jgi:hypothetical protein
MNKRDFEVVKPLAKGQFGTVGYTTALVTGERAKYWNG